MLGPVDVEDWDRSETDELRAEIRSLPVVLLFAKDPNSTGKLIGKRLAEDLLSLSRGADFPLAALVQLRADLTALGTGG